LGIRRCSHYAYLDQSRTLRDRFQCSHQRKIDRNRSNLRPIKYVV
jgi:hypothetical protein